MALARTPATTHDLPATRLAVLDEPLRLYRGGVVESPVIAYETWGTLSPARDNVPPSSRGDAPVGFANVPLTN